MAEIQIHHQLLVKLLDGKHKTLNLTAQSIPIPSLKSLIHRLTSIPTHLQILIAAGRPLHDHQILTLPNYDFPPVIHLLLRLRGGKGGFGSLLRGAATKAGQKKTNNFDACRDMSGRRLRHVNAEKKLEEWRAEVEERKLEKMAEEYLKKKSKAAAKKGGAAGDAATEKYVAKYREDSAKCMEEVEKSVRESIKGFVSSKRKAGEVGGSEAKKLKIWLGKRKLGDSDSEDVDEDDNDMDDEEEENQKSVVTCNSNDLDSIKEAGGSSGSVTGGKLDGESSVGASSESQYEEEETIVKGNKSPSGCSNHNEGNDAPIADNSGLPCSEAQVIPGSVDALAGRQDTHQAESDNMVQTVPPGLSCLGDGLASEVKGNCNAVVVTAASNAPKPEKPLDFDEFSSAADMEVLGMERLKTELQTHGLKCGGTLQERAARLFLLKTTPLEELPKKLLVKK